jgi:hypothetical protein
MDLLIAQRKTAAYSAARIAGEGFQPPTFGMLVGFSCYLRIVAHQMPTKLAHQMPKGRELPRRDSRDRVYSAQGRPWRT